MKKNLLVAAGILSSLALTAQVKSEAKFQMSSDVTPLASKEIKASIPTKPEMAVLKAENANRINLASSKSNSFVAKATAADSPWYYPEGIFYFGCSKDSYNLYATILQAPSFADVTWYNMTDWATSTEWSYQDPNSTSETPDILTSTAQNLTTNCDGLSLVDVPTMKTTGSNSQTGEYQLTSIQADAAGTPALVAYVPTQAYLQLNKDYGVTSYPAAMGFTSYVLNDAGTEFLSGKCEMWTKQGVKSFVNVFDAPAAGYSVNSLYFFGIINNNVPASSAITVSLHKAEKGYVRTEGGDIVLVSKIGEEIGHCTRTVAELTAEMTADPQEPTVSVGMMIFDEFILLDEDDYESEVLPATDGALAVVISGWAEDDAITEFTVATNRQATDAQGSYDPVADSRLNTTFYYWTGSDEDYAVAAYDNTNGAVFMDIDYGYIYEENDITEKVVSAEGEDFELSYASNYSIYDIEGEGMQEWWGLAEEPTFDTETGVSTVKFTVLPLEEGVKGRIAKVTITTWNAGKATLLIKQGDTSGIDNVTEVKDAVLDWNAPVYNVMGQKVSKGFTGIAIQNGNKFIVK